MNGTSTLDGVRVFLPRTPNMDTTGIRAEGTGVKTMNEVSAEGGNGILVANLPPFGPTNNAIVRGAFVRADVGIQANQSQVFVDDALVEATSTGLLAFTATDSAAMRARQVTVVGGGSANSNGIESVDVDAGGPLTSTVAVSNSVVSGFDFDAHRAGGGHPRHQLVALRHDPHAPTDRRQQHLGGASLRRPGRARLPAHPRLGADRRGRSRRARER
jgi:hypothetical protein